MIHDLEERVNALEREVSLLRRERELLHEIESLTLSERGGVAPIIKAAANEFGIPTDDMKKKTRLQQVVAARWVAAHLIRENYPRMSLMMIGGFFCQDHTTIMYALKNIDDRLETDREFRRSYNNVKERIQALKPQTAI